LRDANNDAFINNLEVPEDTYEKNSNNLSQEALGSDEFDDFGSAQGHGSAGNISD